MSTDRVQPQRYDLSLTSIYQALQNPNSSSSLKCRSDLHTASVKQLDYTLRKLKSYTKQTDWPSRRLIRCLDYIFIHGIKPSPNLHLLIQLPSLKACVRWTMTTAATDPDALLGSSKFFCSLLETIASKLPDSTCTIAMLADIRQHGGVRLLLNWCQNPDQIVRTYSVRALSAKVSFFAKDLISLHVYQALSPSLMVIPNLLVVLILKPPISDASQKRSELEQCIMTCRLLESIFKYEQLDHASEALISFTESKQFIDLAQVWYLVCHHEYTTVTNKRTRLQIKNEKLLVYFLSAMIQKCTSISKNAASIVTEETRRAQWQPYLTLLMQHWISNAVPSNQTPTVDTEKKILKKFLQISLDIVPVLKNHMFWQDCVDQTMCDLTNFFMAFVSQPILPEQVETIGSSSTLLHTNLCIDVEERGFTVSADMLIQDRDLLVLFFEQFIQYVQLASKNFIKIASGRVAWSLKSLLTILVDCDQLETSGLHTRISKLIVFFLHYDDAIETFSTCPTFITNLIWSPTIERAKEGLMVAMTLTFEDDLTPEQNNVILKAGRAFSSLQMISSHPRACERLMESDVLQLVSIGFIPNGDIIEKTSSLLAMYALYGGFIAALSRRTAFVRTRLRDECGLFPMILKLLQEAIEHRELRIEKTKIRMGWTQVVSSCLLVVSSFQYDESSMKMWLSWNNHNNISESEEEDYDMLQPSSSSTNKHICSILPSLLAVLFPWRRQKLTIDEVLLSNDHYQVIMLAAQVLEQLSGIPLCGRQMVKDETALSNLSALMVSLTKDSVYVMEDTTHPEEQDSTTPYTNKMELITVELEPMTFVEEENHNTTMEEKEDKMDEKPMMTESLNEQCAGFLRKSATRILISHDNIQYTILNDAFTTFFKPMIQHPSYHTSHEYWRVAICKDLYDKKFRDFMSLYKFTEVAENAIKLYEFTAVAIGYAIIGTSEYKVWNSVLGLGLSEGNIVSSKYIFGVLCQMLVYELEYEEEEEQEQENPSAMLTLITPFRRNAAAQVIEALGLELELIWQVETDSIRESQDLFPEKIELGSPVETVYFLTDDSSELISGNRQLLRARSPIFEALLGSNYAEESKLSSATAIPLHDVSFKSLKLFVSVIHQLNEKVENVLDTSVTTWTDIIDLLLISDRFGSHIVKSKCEHWVLEKVKQLNTANDDERLISLNGLVCLYRHCRDPMEFDGGINSNTWPFAVLVRESLKAIVQFLSLSSQTKELIKMVTDKDIEELNSFCDGMASLLKK